MGIQRTRQTPRTTIDGQWYLQRSHRRTLVQLLMFQYWPQPIHLIPRRPLEWMRGPSHPAHVLIVCPLSIAWRTTATSYGVGCRAAASDLRCRDPRAEDVVTVVTSGRGRGGCRPDAHPTAPAPIWPAKCPIVPRPCEDSCRPNRTDFWVNPHSVSNSCRFTPSTPSLRSFSQSSVVVPPTLPAFDIRRRAFTTANRCSSSRVSGSPPISRASVFRSSSSLSGIPSAAARAKIGLQISQHGH